MNKTSVLLLISFLVSNFSIAQFIFPCEDDLSGGANCTITSTGELGIINNATINGVDVQDNAGGEVSINDSNITSSFRGIDYSMTGSSNVSRLTLSNVAITNNNGSAIFISNNGPQFTLTSNNVLLIKSTANNAQGIATSVSNTAYPEAILNLQLLSSGSIETIGVNSYGLALALDRNNTLLGLQGSDLAIKTEGDNSFGVIIAHIDTGLNTNAHYTANGSITTLGDKAHGIFAVGEITTPIHQSNIGTINLISTKQIEVKGEESSAIRVWTEGSSLVDIQVSGKLLAENNNSQGIYVVNDGSNPNQIIISNDAEIRGGSGTEGAAISLKTKGNQLIDNRGILSAGNDLAIYSVLAGGELQVENRGTIIGHLDMSGATTSSVFNNHTNASIALRNIEGGVIQNTFPNQTIFNNSGIIELHPDNYTGVATHGKLSGIGSFNHSGVIKLGYNKGEITPAGYNVFAGDTLAISGTFISNGGSIILDSVLDDANSNGGIGQSDQLHLENTQRGSRATQLFINPSSNSLGALTVNNGIQVVKVSDNSETGVFTLGHDVLAGAYSYQLVQTGNDWYLTSYFTPPNPIVGNLWNTPTYRPDAGINLANRQSVIEMMVPGLAGSGIAPNGILGSGAMRSNIRLGKNGTMNNGVFSGAKSNNLWSFATASDSKGNAANGQISYSSESYTLQMGGDRTFIIGDSLLQAGAMTHMSMMNSKSLNRLTGTRATGDSDGYGFGLYATWFLRADDILSPFIDTYAMFGRYSNTVKTRNNTHSKYHSNAFSFTVQGGYPIALTDNIILEPQAQLTYVDYKSGQYKDHSGTNINLETKGNMIGRAGAYVYGHGYKVQPYGALNVWYDDTQAEMRYNTNSNKVGADKRGAILEAKVGFQTQTTDNLILWGEISGHKGRNSYHNFGAAIGVKYAW